MRYEFQKAEKGRKTLTPSLQRDLLLKEKSMHDIPEIREQNNLSYQLNDIQARLDWILCDKERFALRVKKQKALIALKAAQKQVYDKFNNII